MNAMMQHLDKAMTQRALVIPSPVSPAPRLYPPAQPPAMGS
ncbi:hypothetical protein [Plesiocystis pacifica]|nr:hypothetical protein [Plesiocystis pacifica]